MKMKNLAIIVMLLFFITGIISGNSREMGVSVKIEYPQDGAIFYSRNVSIQIVAVACCGDKLVAWKWNWSWENGSYEEEEAINYKIEFHAIINISLYPGWNNISVTVKSQQGFRASDKIVIYYDGPVAMANGPYEGNAGAPITFEGSAYGGHKPYKWYWDFGDGNSSTEQKPSHIYLKEGKYKVMLIVTDLLGHNDTDITWAFIGERDDIPPTVDIITPSSGIYINGRRILPSIIPIIVGQLNVEVNATDNVGIRSVAFYLDETLEFNDTLAPIRIS